MYKHLQILSYKYGYNSYIYLTNIFGGRIAFDTDNADQ